VPKKPPATVPQSWIDKLPDAERRNVRAFIRALEGEGIKEAEDLVRRHRDDTTPTIATRLVENRLKQLLDALPEDQRAAARNVAGQVVEILASGGSSVARPAPRWALVEILPEDDGARRRINPRT
jgi:hypothetical protein